MRSDMQKIIVERPRYGSTMRNHKSARRLAPGQVGLAMEVGGDYDGGPSRASSARRDKWLNENLAPLRRYLQKQIGRPWDKVFSEIRATLDTRSAIGLHVMQHLEDFVETKTLMIRGTVYARRWAQLVPAEGLYVHPVTGLIRYIKPRPKPKWTPPVDKEPNFVRLSRNTAFEKIEGIWYRLEYTIAADGLTDLQSKRQCDSKTIRRIDAGDFGLVQGRPHYHWPPGNRT